MNGITLVCFFVLFCIVWFRCFWNFGRTTWSDTFEGRSDPQNLDRFGGDFGKEGLWATFQYTQDIIRLSCIKCSYFEFQILLDEVFTQMKPI